MKQMIQRIREEEGGFTLAELLIVVAIIAVLVAIAIPVFTSSLNNSKAATDEANCRSYYADLQSSYLSSGYVSAKAMSSATSFTLSDGEAITLNTGDTITVTGSDTKGYTVVFTDGIAGGKYTHTWGATQ